MAPNTTTEGARMTPLAALLNVSTLRETGMSLGTYLATRRIPGSEWKSFGEIATEMTSLVGGVRELNRVSVKTFADGYGVPDTRYVDGRSMPRPVSDVAVLDYLRRLREADRPGVDYEVVGANADEAQTRAWRLAQALKDSADGNTADLGDFTQYANDEAAGQ